MVESQQEVDDSLYYDGLMENEETELPPHLTSKYLEQCILYQNDDPDNLRITSAMSNYSRPISR